MRRALALLQQLGDRNRIEEQQFERNLFAAYLVFFSHIIFGSAADKGFYAEDVRALPLFSKFLVRLLKCFDRIVSENIVQERERINNDFESEVLGRELRGRIKLWRSAALARWAPKGPYVLPQSRDQLTDSYRQFYRPSALTHLSRNR